MKLLKPIALLALFSTCLSARARMWGWAEQGNQTISVLGYMSSAATPVQRSYPGATVEVFLTGTMTHASIYSDNLGTPLANPFTIGVSPETSTTGYWFFYADNGTYDVQFSGTGLTTFLLRAISLFDPLGSGAGTVTSFAGSGPAWLTWAVANPTSTPTVTLSPTTGQTSHQVIGTCGAATTFAPCTLTLADLPALSGSFLPITGGTLTGSLLFSPDNTYDIGASGATRPRDLWLGRNAAIGGTLSVIGHTTFEGVTSTGATGTGNLAYSISPSFTTPALGTPSAAVGTNFTGIPSDTALINAVKRANGGLNSASPGTGLLRDGATPAASELSGDCSTFGSNVTVCTGLNGATVTGTSGHLTSFGASSQLADSGVVAANVVTAAAAAGAAKQICTASGASKTCTFIDFPDVRSIPFVNCNNATPALAAASIGSGGTIACRAGTNNKGGYITITDTAGTFAQFTTAIPEDWDATSLPFIRFQVASADTTVSDTIIPQIKVSCAKGDGTTTDDVTFNAAHSLSTITLNATANQFWSTSNIQMNSTDVTGCVAGALMIVQVGRATDTATSAFFYSATLTFPRLLVVQAN